MMKTVLATLLSLSILGGMSAPLHADQEAPIETAAEASPADAGPVVAPAVPPVVDEATKKIEEAPVDFGLDLYQAAKSGKWAIVIGGILLLCTWVLRRYRKKIPFFEGGRGGVLAVMLMSLLAMVGLALAGGEPPSADLALAVFTGMLAAMGGWSGVRRLLWPKD